MGLQFTFFGVRGSLACGGHQFAKYGGNTSCIEVTTTNSRFILDAGTGLRPLGDKIIKERQNNSSKSNHALLFSHIHWDHIIGFPFFKPLYCQDMNFTIMAAKLHQQGGIEAALRRQMQAPFFPVELDAMLANIQFKDFQIGKNFDLFECHIQTAPLNHPNGATAYRINHQGKSLCYVTDTEHFASGLDENILGLIEGADAMIYDCAYTEAEYKHKHGWGHSTWPEGLKLCKAANVRKLYIFHHDPAHDDAFMDALAAEAVAASSLCIVAQEGMQVNL